MRVHFLELRISGSILVFLFLGSAVPYSLLKEVHYYPVTAGKRIPIMAVTRL